MKLFRTINTVFFITFFFMVNSCSEKPTYKINEVDCWIQESYGFIGDTLIIDSSSDRNYKTDSSSLMLFRLKIKADHYNAFMDREDSLIRINFIDIYGKDISNYFYSDTKFEVLQKHDHIIDEYLNVIVSENKEYVSYPLLNIPSTDSLIKSYNSSEDLMIKPSLMISNFIVFKASNDSLINSLNKIEIYAYNYAKKKTSKIESSIKKKSL
jgi:hypothetical protein